MLPSRIDGGFFRATALAFTLLAVLALRSSAGTAEIPLFLDNREVEQIPAFFSKEGAFLAVEGDRFSRALQPYLLPERLADLTARIDANGALSADAIRESGIDFFFDAAHLEARAGIPASGRPVTSMDLARRPEKDSVKEVPPATLSGYLNLLAGRDYIREYSGGDLIGGAPRWHPPVFDFDGAIRAHDTVLEGVVTYRGQDIVPFQRQDFRLVYDLPEERVRTSFGDINYGIRDFQNYQRMGGVSVSRKVELQRSRASAPSAAKILLLERNSRVDVWINGERYQTLELSPGRYDVRNFPLALGTNDVLLHVTDEVGREEDVRFPFVFDSSLLGEWEQDFSYAAGFLSQVTPNGRSYDVHKPAFSFYHDAGITNQITAGGTAQGSERQQTFGADARWATEFGTVRGDVSGSRADFAGAGSAARLQYRHANTVARGDVRSWTALATYRSPAFTMLGDTAASNPFALELGMVYGRRLLWDVFGSLGVGRQLGRAGQPDGATADLSLHRSFDRGLMASVALSRRSAAAGQTENRVVMSLVWNFGLHTLTASQDSAAGTSRLQWHHSASRRVRSIDSDVLFSRDRSSEMTQSELRYRDYRFSAGAAGSIEQDRAPEVLGRRHVSLNLGTALAFADGHVALSRPITDSFVMVSPHPSLSGQTIEVNAGDGIPAAKTGPLGPGVLPEMLSYEEHRVELSAPDLPPWADLGPQPRYVYPGYRSGTLMVAGSGQTVIVEGMLVDDAGRPLSLEPGDLESLDEPSAPPRGFFTAKTGRFAVEGLKPGKLRLVLRNYPDRPIVFVISAGRTGIVDVGTLSFPVFDGAGH
jgi:outer membrane usher protein